MTLNIFWFACSFKFQLLKVIAISCSKNKILWIILVVSFLLGTVRFKLPRKLIISKKWPWTNFNLFYFTICCTNGLPITNIYNPLTSTNIVYHYTTVHNIWGGGFNRSSRKKTLPGLFKGCELPLTHTQESCMIDSPSKQTCCVGVINIHSVNFSFVFEILGFLGRKMNRWVW